MKEIKKILDVMGVHEEERVSLAAFMLRDEADSWWDMIKSTHDMSQMTWIQFEDLLLSNYFPKVVRRQKREEIVHLVQKKLTVTKYASKFTQLSRYVSHKVVNERMQAKQFQEGLKLSIRAQVAPFMIHTYSEVVARALILEREMEETQRLRNKNFKLGCLERREQCVKRQKVIPSQQSFVKQEHNSGNTDWAQGPRKCYECGEARQLRRACPRLQQRAYQPYQMQYQPMNSPIGRESNHKGKEILSKVGL